MPLWLVGGVHHGAMRCLVATIWRRTIHTPMHHSAVVGNLLAQLTFAVHMIPISLILIEAIILFSEAHHTGVWLVVVHGNTVSLMEIHIICKKLSTLPINHYAGVFLPSTVTAFATVLS